MTRITNKGKVKHGAAAPFISTWDTTLGGGNTSGIELPLVSDGNYNFYVNWGDGTTDIITSWDQAEKVHQYNNTGIYNVKIAGTIEGLTFIIGSNGDKIIGIDKADNLFLNNNRSFYSCSNLVYVAPMNFNQDSTNCFQNCSKLQYGLANADVSNVTDMNSFFEYAIDYSEDISNWDVSNVTDMAQMFYGVTGNFSFSGWDVSACQDFNQIFRFCKNTGATEFTTWTFGTSIKGLLYRCDEVILSALSGWELQSGIEDFTDLFRTTPDNMDLSYVTGWDMSSAQKLNSMFMENNTFNEDISAWDTSSVTNTSSMFRDCLAFNQDIGNWNLSNAIDMNNMFNGASSFNQDLSSWDVSNVTNMSYMFYNASSFNQDLSSWDFTSCTNFGNILRNSNSDYSQVTGWTYGTSMRGLLSNLTYLDTSSWSNWHPSRTGVEDYFYFAGSNTTFNSSWITGWDMSNAKNLSQMFYYARAFNQPIGIWDTSNVTSISSTFYEADAFNQPLSGWDTSNVVDMGGTFRRCNIFNQDIGNWNTSNVTTMYAMFNRATVFNNNSSSSISGWDVSNVTNMSQMFDTASAFNQPIGSWDVSNCTTFNQMFRSATSFNQDLSSWNVSGVTDMQYMFYNTNFNNGGSTGINNWDTSSLTTMFGMFYDAITFNQPIGDWDTSSVQNIRFMFYNADAFDQDLSNWVVTGITTATSFMQNANGLSTTNYDRTLSGWSSQAVQNGVNIHFGGSQYSTATGLAYRNALVSAGWTITDGGAA